MKAERIALAFLTVLVWCGCSSRMPEKEFVIYDCMYYSGIDLFHIDPAVRQQTCLIDKFDRRKAF